MNLGPTKKREPHTGKLLALVLGSSFALCASIGVGRQLGEENLGYLVGFLILIPALLVARNLERQSKGSAPQ